MVIIIIIDTNRRDGNSSKSFFMCASGVVTNCIRFLLGNYIDCSDNVCYVFVVTFVISFSRVCVCVCEVKQSSSTGSFYDKWRFVTYSVY